MYHGRGRNLKMLLLLVALGVVYGTLFHSRRMLIASHRVEGMIGVVLGLYICSHPAANMVDLFFYKHAAQDEFSSKLSLLLWVALNALVLGSGWFALFVGTIRLVARAP